VTRNDDDDNNNNNNNSNRLVAVVSDGRQLVSFVGLHDFIHLLRLFERPRLVNKTSICIQPKFQVLK
jgi:hypothetical protein